MQNTLCDFADFLVQQSLQLCILFAIVFAATRCLRSASAHWRYLLWLVVIAKCLTPPLVDLPLPVLRSAPGAAPATAVVERTEPDPPPATILVAKDLSLGDSTPEPPPTSTAAPIPRGVLSTPEPPARIAPSTWVVAIWFVGFVACFAVIARRFWQTQQRLRRTRKPVDEATQELLAEIAGELGMTKPPTSFTTGTSDQPFVWGWVSGCIYLPTHFADLGDVVSRRAILTHELAHVLRREAGVNLVQLVVQSIFYFHPLIWWANREVRREREKCCDEFVLSVCKASPRQYCEAIVDVLARAVEGRTSTPVLAVGGPLDAVEQRIAAILAPNRRFYRHPSWLAKCAALAIACCVLPTAFVLTGRAEPAKDAKTAKEASPDEKQRPSAARDKWQPAQRFEVRIIDSETQKPLTDVTLELQNMGEGIDFQDVKTYKTDADGRAVLQLPDLPPTAVRVYPSKAGYVPLRVYWEEAPWPKLPATVTVPLTRGSLFGGVVKNEEGEPVEGVSVTLNYWASGEGNLPHVRANVDATVKTDAQGRWRLDNMPAQVEPSKLYIHFNHPDYVSDRLRRGYTPRPNYEQAPINEFFKQTAITTLRRGETLHGLVLDKDGNAIPKAAVHLDEQYWWLKEKPIASTDENGRFRIVGLEVAPDAATPPLLTVQAAGYAPNLVSLRDLNAFTTVTLERGHTVRGRVVDEGGKPLKGVDVIERRWREQTSRLGLGMKTGADGRFKLTDLPSDPIDYDFDKDGFVSVDGFTMTPREEEYVVTLKPWIKITGSVFDAETNQPIERFALVKGIDYEDGRAPHWLRYATQHVGGGRYTTDFSQDLAWRLRVEAPGYLPGESRIFRPHKTDRGEIVYDFRLHKAVPLSGTVLSAGGEGLAGAKVYLATSWLNVNKRRVPHHNDNLVVTTDTRGRFEFPPEVEPFCLVAVHDDGLAMVTEKDFAASTQLKIQPWTAANEQQQIIRRPPPGVYVSFPPSEEQPVPEPPAQPKESTESKTESLVVPGQANTLESRTRANLEQEMWDNYAGYEVASNKRVHEPYSLIGGLAYYRDWIDVLPLSEQQVNLLGKLDALTFESQKYSAGVMAEYLKGKPDDFREYVQRNQARREAALRHAERISVAGLLTQSQTALLTRHYLRKAQAYHSLANSRMQELLGITATQKRALVKIWNTHNASYASLNLADWRADSKTIESNYTKMKGFDATSQTDCLAVLTDTQRKIWHDLLAAPDIQAESLKHLIALPESERATIKLKDISLTFRILNQNRNSLGLTPKQQEFLESLDQIVQHGIWWSKNEKASSVPEQIAQEHRQFITHVEQFLLTGILTEKQAEQMQSLLMNK